jgi:hypothetical protein
MTVAAREKPTQKERILALLADREWHTTAELNDLCFRYGARLFELRQEGYLFAEERIGAGPLWRWKLIETPIEAALAPHLARTEAVVEAERRGLGMPGPVNTAVQSGTAAPALAGNCVAASRHGGGSGDTTKSGRNPEDNPCRVSEGTVASDSQRAAPLALFDERPTLTHDRRRR